MYRVLRQNSKYKYIKFTKCEQWIKSKLKKYIKIGQNRQKIKKFGIKLQNKISGCMIHISPGSYYSKLELSTVDYSIPDILGYPVSWIRKGNGDGRQEKGERLF